MPQTTPLFFHALSGTCATILLSLTILVLLSSCQNSPEQTTCTDIPGYISTAPDDPIRRGVLLSLSSKTAPLGLAQVRGFELALDKHKNKLLDHPVVTQMEDTCCTAEGGANSVLKMIATPQTVANSQAQLLFFPLLQPYGIRILLQAKQMSGLEEIVLISDGALIEQSFIGPQRPVGKKVTQLIEEYHNRYNEDPFVSYFLSAFDAADILFTVIESVAIQKDNGTLEIDRKAFRDTLYQITVYPGFTGVLNCDQFGDCGNAAFNILRLDIPEQGVVSLESNIIHGLKMNTIPGRTYKLS